MTKNNFYAEQSVIGDILLDPSMVMPEAMISLSPEDFSVPEYQNIFAACQALYREGRPIDSVTILSAAGSEYQPTLLAAAEATPTISHYRDYIRIVRETAQIRRAAGRAAEFLTAVENGEELDNCRTAAEDVLRCFEAVHRERQELNAADGLLQFFETKEKPRKYIPTGFAKLDGNAYIDRGDYVVIGGRPSAGKTALTLQIMMHMARDYRVAYFSLETSPAKLFDRLVAYDVGVNLTDIKLGKIRDDDWVKIVERSDIFRALRFTVIQAAGWTVDQIRAKALQLQAEVIFVDYIGLIQSSGRDLYERATRTSIDLHTMAQSTGVTVIALAQLNRSGGAGEPDMTALRDSGQIEQDADVVLMLSNPDAPRDKGKRSLAIRKNKEGRTGRIRMSFDGLRQRFYEIDEDREEDR